jgi:hypothetical protein
MTVKAQPTAAVIARRQRLMALGATLLLTIVGCSTDETGPASSATTLRTTPPSTTEPATTTSPSSPPTSTSGSSLPSTVAPSTTGSSVPVSTIDPATLAGITLDTVPADVIVPTSDASLDPVTNPINGRRGAPRPMADEIVCDVADGSADLDCLAATLDLLGFDVTTGGVAERARRVQRALAVIQLDADLRVSGAADEETLDYLAGVSTKPDETRQLGSSQKGRPIIAERYGDGPTVVLVVGQTHGDEEGGLRVLLRLRTMPLPESVTLWVVPTMNPDGGFADTRFLADGADPNRKAPTLLEQQGVHALALEVQPAVTVWYHQNYGWIGGSGASMEPARTYQQASGMTQLNRSGDCAKRFTWCPIDEALGSSSILVELPDVLTSADVHAHASALLAVLSG